MHEIDDDNWYHIILRFGSVTDGLTISWLDNNTNGKWKIFPSIVAGYSLKFEKLEDAAFVSLRWG